MMEYVALEITKYAWIKNLISYYALDVSGVLHFKPDDWNLYRPSNLTLEELLELHKPEGIRSEYSYLITDKKEIAKYLMTRELLK